MYLYPASALSAVAVSKLIKHRLNSEKRDPRWVWMNEWEMGLIRSYIKPALTDVLTVLGLEHCGRQQRAGSSAEEPTGMKEWRGRRAEGFLTAVR